MTGWEGVPNPDNTRHELHRTRATKTQRTREELIGMENARDRIEREGIERDSEG